MMKRRNFMGLAAAALIAPLPALASEFEAYAPGVIAEALAAGETVFVDYAADWCSTCARQERVIADLRAADPRFDAAMTFVRVDWDQFRGHEVTTSRNIPRRSTLLVLRGDAELGRIVAGTSQSDIRALMELGL